MQTEPTTTKPLTDYDFLIRQARDIHSYADHYNMPAMKERAERLLAFWLERKERSEQR
jgi:hypothetical protein